MGASRILAFGATDGAGARLTDCSGPCDTAAPSPPRSGGKRCATAWRRPAGTTRMNSLARAGGRVRARRRSRPRRAGARRGAGAEGPRRARARLHIAGGDARADRRKLQRQPGFDARRASTCSARCRPASAAGASRCWATCCELGDAAPLLHRGLAPDLSAAKVDLVFLVGPQHEAPVTTCCRTRMRGAHRRDLGRQWCEPLIAQRCTAATSSGQGIAGQRAWRRCVDALRAARPPPADARNDTTADGRLAGETLGRCSSTCCRLWPTISSASTCSATSPSATGGAILTAFVPHASCSARDMIRWLKSKQREGQPIRSDGPETHLLTKKGTPTMGGLMILIAVVRHHPAVGGPDQQLCLGRAAGHHRLRRDRLRRRLPEADQAQHQGPARPRQAGRRRSASAPSRPRW